MKRLLAVYNPHSTNYCRVEREVLSRLPSLKSTMIGKFTIEKAPFEHNVARLKRILRDDDLVVVAGGDATAAVTVNAIMESGKDVTLGVLPYGNFNDLARTLGTMHPSDIFDTEHQVKKLYPLDITVDGKHWRYASCYVTAGMTAEAVELFDEPKFRAYMQKGHKSSWRSYLALAGWYFKHRRKKTFIPDCTINGGPVRSGLSDYCALSGRSMCRVMKGGSDYLQPKTFRSAAYRLTSFPRLFILMTRSILHRTPGTETTHDCLEFTDPATIELQAEGEYHTFHDVRTITVKKPNKSIKVITKGSKR